MTIKVTEETMIRKIYSGIEYEGEKYILIDLLNENGRVMDSTVRDEYGNEIDDPDVYSAIDKIIDEAE